MHCLKLDKNVEAEEYYPGWESVRGIFTFTKCFSTNSNDYG